MHVESMKNCDIEKILLIEIICLCIYIYMCVCVCVCVCIYIYIYIIILPDGDLPTKLCLVKAMVFPVVMYGCESWTIKKVEH